MKRFGATIGALLVSLVVHAKDSNLPHYIVDVDDTRYLLQYDHDDDQLLGYAREFFDEFARQRHIHIECRHFQPIAYIMCF